jgi:hypothetical protein
LKNRSTCRLRNWPWITWKKIKAQIIVINVS